MTTELPLPRIQEIMNYNHHPLPPQRASNKKQAHHRPFDTRTNTIVFTILFRLLPPIHLHDSLLKDDTVYNFLGTELPTPSAVETSVCPI